MLDKILNFLERIKWWILLAIILAGFYFIYWGDR
jgi:hypothetical protein